MLKYFQRQLRGDFKLENGTAKQQTASTLALITKVADTVHHTSSIETNSELETLLGASVLTLVLNCKCRKATRIFWIAFLEGNRVTVV